jgi:putative transport protein
MDWINDLLFKETVAHTIFIYSIVIALGISLGKIKLFGISLGITFVLFVGIVMGHFGFSANHEVIAFIRDFGLILFVFSIGLQVGPGFFSSFKKGGITLNLFALAIVFLGALTTIGLHFLTGMSMPMLVGVMSGAVTNTPGLGAAQQALTQTGNLSETLPDIGLGYAVAYPFGVLGIILAMLALRKFQKVNLNEELDLYNQKVTPSESIPEKISILVNNPKIYNKTISEISKIVRHDVVISRVLHNGELHLASSDTVVSENDIILRDRTKPLPARELKSRQNIFPFHDRMPTG